VTWIAAASAQGFVDVIDLPAWKKVATISGVMAGMYRPVFSGDRSRLAIGSSGKESVTIWDTVSFERLLTLPTSRSVTGIIGFSPDGNLLLARTGLAQWTFRMTSAPSSSGARPPGPRSQRPKAQPPRADVPGGAGRWLRGFLLVTRAHDGH
jgi:WD40 repeat protein